MWLPIVICLAALAMIMGPIMMMQPTAAQRRQAGLRQQAESRGLRVHMRPLSKKSAAPPVPLYCLPWASKDGSRQAWFLVRQAYSHGIHAHGVWDWQQKPAGRVDMARLGPLLDRLPEQVQAVASDSLGLCCYWNERGGEAVLQAIIEWLNEAVACLSVDQKSPGPAVDPFD